MCCIYLYNIYTHGLFNSIKQVLEEFLCVHFRKGWSMIPFVRVYYSQYNIVSVSNLYGFETCVKRTRVFFYLLKVTSPSTYWRNAFLSKKKKKSCIIRFFSSMFLRLLEAIHYLMPQAIYASVNFGNYATIYLNTLEILIKR